MALILGLSIGIPLALVFIAVLSLFIARKRLRQDIKNYEKEKRKTLELQNVGDKWKENDSHKTGNQTEWNDYI